MKQASKLCCALLILLLCGCGVKLDTAEVVLQNGTACVQRDGVEYTIQDGVITAGGEVLTTVDAAEDVLFVQGQYAYVNTDEGAMQVRLSNGKTKRYGKGRILYTKGEWIYYMNYFKSASGNGKGVLLSTPEMVFADELPAEKDGYLYYANLYQISALDGKQSVLSSGNIAFSHEEEDALYFTVADGTLLKLRDGATEVEVQKPLAEEVAVDEPFDVDLDGDGTKETVLYDAQSLTIDGKDFSKTIERLVLNDFVNPYGDFYLVTDLDDSDGAKELAFRTDGPSNDPETVFFRYDGTQLRHVGSVPSDTNVLSFLTPGVITGEMRLALLQTWWGYASWVYRDGEIQLSEQDVYDVVAFEEAPDVVLKKPLPLYHKRGDEEAMLTLAPQPVRLTQTDNRTWCALKAEDGTRGWFRVENFDTIADLGLQANEVFDNLYQAD